MSQRRRLGLGSPSPALRGVAAVTLALATSCSGTDPHPSPHPSFVVVLFDFGALCICDRSRIAVVSRIWWPVAYAGGCEGSVRCFSDSGRTRGRVDHRFERAFEHSAAEGRHTIRPATRSSVGDRDRPVVRRLGGWWSRGNGVLWNIDPQTRRVLKTVTLPSRPDVLTVESQATTPSVWGLSPSLGIIFQVDARTGQLMGSNFFGLGMSDLAADRSLVWESDVFGSIAQFASLTIRSPCSTTTISMTSSPFQVRTRSPLVDKTSGFSTRVEAGSSLSIDPHMTLEPRSRSPLVPSTSSQGDRSFGWRTQALSRVSQTTHLVTTASLPGLVVGIAAEVPGAARRGLVWVLVTGSS